MFFIQACRGGECPNTKGHVFGMPLRLILHTYTPSHSTCCQLSSLLLSGVSGTHIHLPLPCCCHCICCSVSVFCSAWGVCIDLQTPEHLSDKNSIISHSYIEAFSCYACSRGSGAHGASNCSTAWSGTLALECCLRSCLSLDPGCVVSLVVVSQAIRLQVFFFFFFLLHLILLSASRWPFLTPFSTSYCSYRILFWILIDLFFFHSFCSYFFLILLFIFPPFVTKHVCNLPTFQIC